MHYLFKSFKSLNFGLFLMQPSWVRLYSIWENDFKEILMRVILLYPTSGIIVSTCAEHYYL